MRIYISFGVACLERIAAEFSRPHWVTIFLPSYRAWCVLEFDSTFCASWQKLFQSTRWYPPSLRLVEGFSHLLSYPINPRHRYEPYCLVRWISEYFVCSTRLSYSPIYTRHDVVVKWTRNNFLCEAGKSKFLVEYFFMGILSRSWSFRIRTWTRNAKLTRLIIFMSFKIWHRYAHPEIQPDRRNI